MAVEKMEMFNLIGHIDDIDEIAKKIIISSCVQITNAVDEIQNNNFPILKSNDVDAVIDYSYIKPYVSQRDFADVEDKINSLAEIFDVDKYYSMGFVKEDYNFSDDEKELNNMYNSVKDKDALHKELIDENNELTELEESISPIKGLNINLNDILKMKHIKMKYGSLPKYDMEKLKNNYENISAIVFKVSEDNEKAVIMAFIPEPVENEVDRVLASLNFNEYKFKRTFEGTPKKWIQEIEQRKNEIKKEISQIKNDLLNIEKNWKNDVNKYYSKLIMEYKIEELKSNIACTNEFFYLTGWVPSFNKRKLEKLLSKYEDRSMMIFKKAEEINENMEPPTCLRNGYLIRPFESIVKLYGIPSYNELDPTTFVGLTYMLLFGAMFGDVGQGLVLFLAGEFLYRIKKRPNLGGVIARLGISSMIFGFLYGSVFGNEELIKALVIKPMEQINTVLISAIVLGVVLLVIGFIYNMINSYKRKDIENGLFSKNGAAGLCFFLLLLFVAYTKVENVKTIIPSSMLSLSLLVLLIITMLKEPLANAILGKPLYNESVSDYYVESGFGVLETLLSILSNTISFIRVGAFAINHVGLFMAFKTISDMMSNHFESTFMLILGNVIIIGLEGLIVFIQGLRLEYYELFSKYFVGEGYEYTPMEIDRSVYRKSSKSNMKKNIKQNVSIEMN